MAAQTFTQNAVNLTLALALATVVSPTAVFAQQSPAATATTTPTPIIPPAIRAMTTAEKVEYDNWVAAAQVALKERQGTEAETLLRKILAREEVTFGPQHPEVAGTLTNITSLYDQQGKYRESEPLLRRALAIFEKTLGPEHRSTAAGLNNLAFNLDDLGRASEGEPLFRRALAIFEKTRGSGHPDTAISLSNLATNLRIQGRANEAEPLFRRGLAIFEKVRGPEHPDTAQSLDNLAKNLGTQGRANEAEPLLRRALAIREKIFGPEHPDTAQTLNNLAVNLNDQGRAIDAEPLYRRALAINERVLGPENPGTATSLNNMASKLDAQGRAKDAESLLRRALAIREKVLGPEHPSTAQSLNNLAENLRTQGRTKEAEPLLRLALAIREKVLGPEHPDTAQSLNNLALHLDARGRANDAELLYRRALAINEKTLGPEHPDTALSLNNVASNLYDQGRSNDAEPLMRRALAIREEILGPEHPDTAISLTTLALNLVAQGRANDAEPLMRRALAIREEILGPDHPDTALSLNNLAANLRFQGRAKDTEPLLSRALAISEKALGPEHHVAAQLAENLSLLQLVQSPFAALVSSRQALKIRRSVAGREGVGADESAQVGLSAATGNASLLFVRAALIVGKADSGSAALTAESFSAVQSISVTSAGRALARSTALASLDARGQALAQAWEQSLGARAFLDSRFTAAAGVAGANGDALRARLSQERVQLDGEVKTAEEQLRAGYPAYFQLIAPGPVELAELQKGVAGQQALLGANEALILVTPGDTRFPKGQQRGLVFAVTREGVAWGEIGIDPEALKKDITGLRQLLDGGGSTRAPGSGGPQTGAQRGYDRATARRVYDALFGSPEIAKLIAGKKEWLISPQGALLSLPFAALVAGDYAGDDADVTALRTTPWLGMTKALSVIPEVSSLKALRGLTRPARATQTPFFGMGDPDFARGAGPSDTKAAASVAIASAAKPRSGGGTPGQVRGYFRDAGADIGAISKLSPLPGTRGEIEALAKSFKTNRSSYLLGDEATEKNLRDRSSDGSLGRARVVAFATHGLIAGDLGRSLAQPALAFTPPAPKAGAVTESDDGLLTAGEAATLKLGADWVILSACNTASGGDNSADGLTGLARAFFYAGADTLLVSHWRVRDDAAARLTTRAVEISQGSGSQKLSRAAALQQSMRELMNDTSQDNSGSAFAHPSAWAPFTIIGVER